MDRDIDVRTPESISFQYELAGLGSRFLAVTLDLLVQIAMVVLLVIGFAFLPKDASVGKSSPELERFFLNIGIALVVFILFAIFFGYFIVLEAVWNGQTLGKKALGIRVVRDGGYPIDFSASLVRNLIRIGEWGIGGYAIAAIAALLSKENKRVGDIAAGTIVVRDARMVTSHALLAELREAPPLAATAYLDTAERELVRRFLDRRDRFAPDRRATLAAELAGRFRPRLPAEWSALRDEDLLERL